MRTRRLLLAASALSTLAFGCKSDQPKDPPPPGNPKGTLYDDAMAAPPPDAAPVTTDAATRDASVRPPGDAGLPRDATGDAAPPSDAAAPRDAAGRPRDAASRPPPGNPKGSRYDAGPDIDLLPRDR